MRVFLEFVKGICALACVAVGFCGLFIALSYAGYEINLWRNPCTRVYNGDVVIYEGSAAFYTTETRGAATIFQEYQKRPLFPRMIQEIISDEIRVETIACE